MKALLLAIAVLVGHAHAQDWPAKPLRMILPVQLIPRECAEDRIGLVYGTAIYADEQR